MEKNMKEKSSLFGSKAQGIWEEKNGVINLLRTQRNTVKAYPITPKIGLFSSKA